MQHLMSNRKQICDTTKKPYPNTQNSQMGFYGLFKRCLLFSSCSQKLMNFCASVYFIKLFVSLNFKKNYSLFHYNWHHLVLKLCQSSKIAWGRDVLPLSACNANVRHEIEMTNSPKMYSDSREDSDAQTYIPRSSASILSWNVCFWLMWRTHSPWSVYMSMRSTITRAIPLRIHRNK